jgi:hypothetical protein
MLRVFKVNIVMLRVFKVNIVMLSVFIINVIMLNVVAPEIACRIPTVILKVSGHVYPVASVGLIRVKVSKSSLSAQMSEKVKIKVIMENCSLKFGQGLLKRDVSLYH